MLVISWLLFPVLPFCLLDEAHEIFFSLLEVGKMKSERSSVVSLSRPVALNLSRLIKIRGRLKFKLLTNGCHHAHWACLGTRHLAPPKQPKEANCHTHDAVCHKHDVLRRFCKVWTGFTFPNYENRGASANNIQQESIGVGTARAHGTFLPTCPEPDTRCIN